MSEAMEGQRNINRDPGLVPDDSIEITGLPAGNDQDITVSTAEEAVEISKRQEEIDSLNLTSAPVVEIPKHINRVNLNEMNIGKLKRDKESQSNRKINEIPFFYFIKDGQRYIFTPPEVAGMADTCLITSAWFNILEIFQVKPLLCSTSIQNSVKLIKSDIHNQMLKALPYAAWFLGREGIEEPKKLSVKQCVLILEHFVLQKKGERYNRKHTKYRSVNATFLDNFINKKECSEYQKALLMSIRNILMTELKSSSIDTSTVVDYVCDTWNGKLPKYIKETYSKQEQGAISLVSSKQSPGSISIDRTASIGHQTRQVEDYIKEGINKNALYKDQIIEIGKMRRKAISGYFPVNNPNNMKKTKFADLYERFKNDSNNLEILNPLQIVPSEGGFTITALSVPMNYNDDEYNEVLNIVSGKTQSKAIAASIMSIYMREKDIFKTISSNRR